MTDKRRTRYSEAVIAMVRKADNAREASRLTGVSHSYCKAIRREDRRSGDPTPPAVSLIQRVVDLVCEKGRATADDLAPLLPEYTRRQVARAMNQAHFERRILKVQIGKRLGHLGSKPSVYGPGDAVKSYRRGPRPSQPEVLEEDDDDEPLVTRTCIRGEYGIPRVASVWDLGASA